MHKVVVDTNVIVSALLTPAGTTGRLLESLFGDFSVSLVVSNNILNEYSDVLSRKKFSFDKEKIDKLLIDIKFLSECIVPIATTTKFNDESDHPFYDAAVCSGAVLITGNKKHFPNETFILSPSEYMSLEFQ